MNQKVRKRTTWQETITRDKIEKKEDTSFDAVQNIIDRADNAYGGTSLYPYSHGNGAGGTMRGPEYVYSHCTPLGPIGTPQFNPGPDYTDPGNPTKGSKTTTPQNCTHCPEGEVGCGDAKNYGNNWVNGSVTNTVEHAGVTWRYRLSFSKVAGQGSYADSLPGVYKRDNLETTVNYPIKVKTTSQTRTYNAWCACYQPCYAT